jgi:hypothetical protein
VHSPQLLKHRGLACDRCRGRVQKLTVASAQYDRQSVTLPVVWHRVIVGVEGCSMTTGGLVAWINRDAAWSLKLTSFILQSP